MLAAVVAATGLVGCEPPPPRLVLAVTSNAASGDDVPGDGVCTSVGGGCTLLAAIQEANATVGGVDVTLPSGYQGAVTVVVTGDVRINPGAASTVALTGSTLTVGSAGRLEIAGLNRSRTDRVTGPVDLIVLDGGVAIVDRSFVTVQVRAGATAIASASIIGTSNVATFVAGTLVAAGSTIVGGEQVVPEPAVLSTSPGGATVLRGSVVARPWVSYGAGFPLGTGGEGTCVGTPPTSKGWMFVEVGCGSTPEPGDASGDAGVQINLTVDFTTYGPIGFVHRLNPGSPLIDAIPVGAPGCEPGVVDLYDTPRGNDGNGDGVPGCDIGAVEHVRVP